jgi:VWFA-related protein
VQHAGAITRFAERFSSLLLLSIVSPALATCQQSNPPEAVPESIYLDVVVGTKSGPAVSGLRQQDFTVLDGKAVVPLDSFQAVLNPGSTIEVVVVIDDLNTSVSNAAYARSELRKFLGNNGGQLAQPTALAFLTDSGIHTQDTFTKDGNVLSTSLDQYPTGLPSLPRSGGVYSDLDRFRISTNALFQLATQEASRPGRKLILWVSPGWPLLALPDVQEQMDDKQQHEIFSNIAELSTRLSQGRITLYGIDPRGDADFATRALEWQAFVKELTKPSQAHWGNMALQVLALHSGGLVLTGSNDFAASLQRCLADAQAYYELSFTPLPDKKRDVYHLLEVRVAKPGLTARTGQGYYSERFETAAVAQVQQVARSNPDGDTPPYVDQPLDQLVRSIPELAALQPSPDQQLLPTILSETATKVDEFFDNTIDLLAEEDITRSILKSNGSIRSSQQLRYNYLIVHHVDGLTIEVEEYRTDANGNRVEQAGLEQGFSFTSGFALICIHFSKDFRSDSRFRYLGRELLGSRNTYVVAFAEKPGQARAVDSASGPWGKVDLLVQGIAWVDEGSSQIVRIRTDLLAPHPEIGLEQQTTEVSFQEIHLLDVPEPLWLPSGVRVDARFQGKNFRNDHRYTNYRRYRVASKMLGPS